MNIFLVIIGIHIAGALIDKYIKKGDAVDSMVTGYKNLSQKENIKMNILQKLYITIALAAFLYSIYYLGFMENIFIS